MFQDLLSLQTDVSKNISRHSFGQIFVMCRSLYIRFVNIFSSDKIVPRHLAAFSIWLVDARIGTLIRLIEKFITDFARY